MRSPVTDVERPYIKRLQDGMSLEEQVALVRDVKALGYSDSAANGLLAWLIRKAAGDHTSGNDHTRSRYRQMLRSLNATKTRL